MPRTTVLLTFAALTLCLLPFITLAQDNPPEKPEAKETPAKPENYLATSIWEFIETRVVKDAKNQEGWQKPRCELVIKATLDPKLGKAISFAYGADFKAVAGDETLDLHKGYGDLDADGLLWQNAGNHHTGPQSGELEIEASIEGVPSRAAKTLTISGELLLLFASEIEEKKVIGLGKSESGSVIFEDKIANLRIEMVKNDEGEVELKVSGDPRKLLHPKLFDGAGEEIWGPSSFGPSDDGITFGFNLDAEQLKEFSLHFEFAKTLAKRSYSIELKDFKLP